MEKRITIVIPTMNRIEKLKSVLPSYLQQEYLLEVIIIDDGSTDATQKYFIENSNSKIRYIKNQSSMGAAKSKYKGLQIAQGDLVLFGEDDLYLDENYTAVLVENLESEKADFIAGRIIYLNENESEESALERNNIFKEKLYDNYFNHNFHSIRNNNEEVIFLHGIFLARKIAILKIGIDEAYKGNGWREETDPLIVAKTCGYKVIFCPFTVCFHLPRGTDKGGQHNFSKLVYEYWIYKNNLYFYKKNESFLKQNKIIKYSPYLDNNIYMCNRIYKNYISKLFPKFKKLLNRSR